MFKISPEGTNGHLRFPTLGRHSADCEPALKPYEICSAVFSGQAFIWYENTARSATSLGVHLEWNQNSVILMCVPITATALAGGRVIGYVVLCKACSIAVVSDSNSTVEWVSLWNLWSKARIFPGASIYIQSIRNCFMTSCGASRQKGPLVHGNVWEVTISLYVMNEVKTFMGIHWSPYSNPLTLSKPTDFT